MLLDPYTIPVYNDMVTASTTAAKVPMMKFLFTKMGQYRFFYAAKLNQSLCAWAVCTTLTQLCLQLFTIPLFEEMNMLFVLHVHIFMLILTRNVNCR